MSHLIDDQADEVSSDSDSYDGEKHKASSKKKTTKRQVFDSSEEEEEEDEEQLKEVARDLINDDDEEEENSDDDDEDGDKRKRGDDEESIDDDLDEEDLNLLEENLGVRLDPRGKKKKYKRVKRIDDDDSDREEGKEDAREAIANELFDEDDEPHQPQHVRNENRYEDDDASDSASSVSDFIVDDEDQPIHSRQRKRKGIKCNDEQLQQAQDLFGVTLSDFEDAGGFGDEYYDEEQDEAYEDEEGEQLESRRKSRRKLVRKSIFEIYEPTELEKSHLTEADQEIREMDLPERFRLRSIPVKETSDEAEIDEEAEWIFHHAFHMEPLTKPCMSTDPSKSLRKDARAISKIRETLKFIRSQFFEVPYISTYKKEYIEDVSNDDLWTIYRWDEKFCQLKERRENMLKLYNNMYAYQIEQLAQGKEVIRTISDSDLGKIQNISSFEELHDFWLQFQLFYSSDLPEMKKELAKKSREKKKEERERRKLERQQRADEGAGEAAEEEEEEENDDEEEAINLRFSSLKLAQRKDPYTICKEASVGLLAREFGLSVDQLAANIHDNYTKYEVSKCTRLPHEVASDFVSPRFNKPESVLDAARFMVAKEISCHPVIRKAIRSVFHERGVVNVRPTKKGLKEGIDESHSCYTFKYLKEKPIHHFTGLQFLHLLKAEADGLLEVKITVDVTKDKAKSPDAYIKEILPLYTINEFSDLVKSWNNERQKALELALNKMLYPSIEKELKIKMKNEATTAIASSCGRALRQWLSVPPYLPPSNVTEDPDYGLQDGVRVLGFAFTPDIGESCFAAFIDGDGEVVEHLRLPHFMLRTRGPHASETERNLREKDINKLKNFILSRKPHVITLAADGMDTRRVMTELHDIVDSMSMTDSLPRIHVEVLDNDVASVYSNSRRGKLDFPDYPPLLRQAISVARRLQDPLIEFTQLCSPDEEILCLRYHPYQDRVPKDELLDAISVEFVNMVNAVGVDVNDAIAHPHKSNLVQFIAGFGPRKATAFLKTLKRLPAQCLESRTQLIMECKFGAKVFINCAGFIKIDTAMLADSNTETYIEILDSTRVHPEAYEWARKMAVDALEDETDGYDESERDPSQALEAILENPKKLEDLDLDAFAQELEKQGFGNKMITLYDIRKELSCRFKDPRIGECIKLSPEDMFYMLSKETRESFKRGSLVTGIVATIVRKPPQRDDLDNAQPIFEEETRTYKCPNCHKLRSTDLTDIWNHFDSQQCPGKSIGIKIRLDNGIQGFVRTELLSDSEVREPEDRIRINMVVHARILKINFEKFTVDLTCRTSDLNDVRHEHREPKDVKYDYDAEDADLMQKEKAKKKQHRKAYIKRIIVHPSFHNIDFAEAERKLADAPQGDAIIRPSSKGEDHLTLTWKVHTGIHQHIDIVEQGKDNAFSLGKQLVINGEAYEDLDEIIARYIQPMAGHARDLINFKYFRNAEGGKEQLMESYLKEEKKKQPNKIHYFVSASKQYPGKFLLSYLPKDKCRHEFFSIVPDGFRFRGRIFHSVNAMLQWFKEHWREHARMPPPNVISASASMSNTPMAISTPHGTPHTPHTPAGPFGDRVTPSTGGQSGRGLTPMSISSTPMGSDYYPSTVKSSYYY